MSEDYEYRIWQAERKIKEQMNKNNMNAIGGYISYRDAEVRNKELKKVLNDLGGY